MSYADKVFIDMCRDIIGVMEHINIRSNQVGVEKRKNCKFTTL